MDELQLEPFPRGGSKALFKALTQWQRAHSVVKKDADGRFKYASLEVVTHFVSSACEFGLSHYYRCTAAVPEYEGGPSRTEVTAFLVHQDGGYAHSSLVIDDYNPKMARTATSNADRRLHTLAATSRPAVWHCQATKT